MSARLCSRIIPDGKYESVGVWRRRIAQVSSGVVAGLHPTPGRSVIATARPAGELLHAYPRMSATVIAQRVILISLAAGPNCSRPYRGEKFAHRENYDRLTR